LGYGYIYLLRGEIAYAKTDDVVAATWLLKALQIIDSGYMCPRNFSGPFYSAVFLTQQQGTEPDRRLWREKVRRRCQMRDERKRKCGANPQMQTGGFTVTPQ
jgi:hypothetical protein